MAKINLSETTKFLQSLETGVNPTLHVNGVVFASAVVVIDFGTPLRPIKLSNEQNQDLTARLRKLTRDLLGTREATIRVNNDYQNGIFWTSIG